MEVWQRIVITKGKDFLGSDSAGFSDLEVSQEDKRMENTVKVWKRNRGQEKRLIEEKDRDWCKC